MLKPDDNIRFNHWYILVILAAVTITLGIEGYSEIIPRAAGEKHYYYWGDALYHTLMLFGLSDWAAVNVPLKLQIARWLGFITASYFVIYIIFLFAKQKFDFIRLRFFKNHIIICGLNDWSSKLIDSYLEQHYSKKEIVIIEADAQNDKILLYRQKGALIITGQPGDSALLAKARVKHAHYVFAFTQEDETNINIALNIYHNSLNSIKKKHPNKSSALPDDSSKLNLYVHVLSPQIHEIFKQHHLFKAANSLINARIFNIYENSTRQILKYHSPDILSPAKAKHTAEPIHIVILGFGAMGFHLTLQFIKQGFYANQEKPIISIIDADISKKQPSILQQFPECMDFAKLKFCHQDASLVKAQTIKNLHARQTIDVIYYCLENDFQSIYSANRLARQLQASESTAKIGIIVCMPENTKLSPYITDAQNDDKSPDLITFSPIKIFNIISKSSTWDVIVNEKLDEAAMILHEEYYASQFNAAKQQESIKPWSELAEEYRESCRLKADYRELIKRAYNNNPEIKPENLIECLAQMEHRRWCVEKVFNGWSYGAIRNDQIKTNPLLTKWENLSETDKEYNREDTRKFIKSIGINKN